MVRKILLGIALLCLSVGVGAADFSDYYGNASSFFTDPNTGLTVFPILELPLGGRAIGMGTAYTAVTLDSGAITSNPASTALLPLTELALTHNNWIADSSLEGVAYTRRFGNLGIGAAAQYLHIPFTSYDSWGETAGAARISEGVAVLNASYNFLSSYYFSGISLGANVKGAFRVVPATLYSDQSLFSAMADLGVLTQFNLFKPYVSRDKNFSIGASVKNLGLAAKDDPLPSLFSAGLAYSPIRPLILSFDYNLPFVLKADTPAKSWYLSGGANLEVTDFFSVQTGFSYGGANPKFSLGSALDLEDISILVNYTLDLTTQMRAFDRFSLEAKMNMGDEGRQELSQLVDAYYLAGLEAYANGEMDTALQYWRAALKLDPTYQPAQEFLLTLTQTLDLYNRMEEMNKLR